jgi:hypothetical protein
MVYVLLLSTINACDVVISGKINNKYKYLSLKIKTNDQFDHFRDGNMDL